MTRLNFFFFICTAVVAQHSQQCNDTTYMLLTAFCGKNLPSRFLHGDLFEWRRSSFFCCLIEVVDFRGAAILSSVCRPFHRSKQKSGTRHDDSPAQTILRSTPHRFIRSQSFPLQNPFSTSFGRQPFVSKDRWPRCTLWNRFSVPLSVEKIPKTASKLHAQGRSGPQRSKKITRTSTLMGRPRARTPSSSTSVAVFSIAGAHPALRFFLRRLQLYRRPGNLFYLYTSQNKPKNPTCTWCTNHGFQTCMQPSLMFFMQPKPACNTSMHSRCTQITGMVTSFVVLRFARTPPPLCHS